MSIILYVGKLEKRLPDGSMGTADPRWGREGSWICLWPYLHWFFPWQMSDPWEATSAQDLCLKALKDLNVSSSHCLVTWVMATGPFGEGLEESLLYKPGKFHRICLNIDAASPLVDRFEFSCLSCGNWARMVTFLWGRDVSLLLIYPWSPQIIHILNNTLPTCLTPRNTMITIISHLQRSLQVSLSCAIQILLPMTAIIPTLVLMVMWSHLAFSNPGFYHPHCY